jgi:hypothetical protein
MRVTMIIPKWRDVVFMAVLAAALVAACGDKGKSSTEATSAASATASAASGTAGGASTTA